MKLVTATIGALWMMLMASTALCQEDQEPADDGLGTTVIGSQEAPTVLNVVPWKERKVEVERRGPSSSLLERMLEPLDRDVLSREIEYHNMQQQDLAE